MSLYRGFSTRNQIKKFRVVDYDLVKIDLINSLHIRPCEKLMNPDYGCKIWDMLFDNQTPEFRSDFIKEIQRVCSLDPRLRLQDINLILFEHGVRADLEILYTGESSPVSLSLYFDTDSQTITEV